MSPSQPVVDERTALLQAVNDEPYRHSEADAAIHDDELSGDLIDANEFDLMLSKSNSYTGGLGIEPESQTQSMLQNSRRHSHSLSHRKSHNSLRRSICSGIEGALEEEDEDGEGEEQKSPFLGGVSVFRFWLIFGGVLANNFVACFDSTIMASSHPVITSYFHSSNSASWLSTAFLLTSTAFQPLFGRLSDTIGRKPPYICTLIVFLLATIWCGLAQSMTTFIIARALCGLGAGGMMVMGSIITSDLVPIEIRGAYQSYINIVFGIGSALGAATGGAIADRLGWRWEFGIQVPAIVACVVMAMITTPNNLGLEEGVTKKGLWEAMRAFDFKGSILLTSSITCLILGLASAFSPMTSALSLTPNRIWEEMSILGPIQSLLPP
jgi:nitrate/nitrite transporter NarK